MCLLAGRVPMGRMPSQSEKMLVRMRAMPPATIVQVFGLLLQPTCACCSGLTLSTELCHHVGLHDASARKALCTMIIVVVLRFTNRSVVRRLSLLSCELYTTRCDAEELHPRCEYSDSRSQLGFSVR